MGAGYEFFNCLSDAMLAYTGFPLESSASKLAVRNKIRLSEGILLSCLGKPHGSNGTIQLPDCQVSDHCSLLSVAGNSPSWS